MERPVMDHSDHGQGSNFTAASSKSSSISVELEVPLPVNEAGKMCNHFGIRQYVVDMRGKDKKICLPFSSHDNIEPILPPMAVPKYKYWRCQNCLYGNGVVSPLEEAVVVNLCCKNVAIPKTTCSPNPPNHDVQIVQSDIHDSSQKDRSEGRIVVRTPGDSVVDHGNDLSATDKNEKRTETGQMTETAKENVNNGKSQQGTGILLGEQKHSSPTNDKKEKTTDIGQRVVNGNENGSYEESIRERANANYNLLRDTSDSFPAIGHLKSKTNSTQSFSRKENNSLDGEPMEKSQQGTGILLGEQKHSSPNNDKKEKTTDIGQRDVNGNENGSYEESIRESANANYNLPRDTSDSFPAIGHLKSKTNSTQSFSRKENNSLDGEPSNGLAGSSASNEATKSNRVTHPSRQTDEGGSLPESDKNRDLEDDDSSEDSERPKKKKRSLRDLLKEKGNSENSHCRTEGTPSNSIPGVLSTSVSNSVPQVKTNQHENVLGVRVPQRKRKAPYSQEKKPMVMNSPSNQSKSAGPSKGNADISNKAIEISDSDADSESEGKVDGVFACNYYNNNWSGRERSSLGKNRKTAQGGDHNITKVPWREVITKVNHADIRGGNKHTSAADTGSSKSKHDLSTSKGIEPHFRGNLPPRKPRERKSSLTKKRNIMPQVQDTPALIRPPINHMLGEGSVRRKDFEAMRTGSEARKTQLESDARADLPLDLTLNGYVPSAQDGMDRVKAGRGFFFSNPTGKSNIFQKDFTRRDEFCAGESSGLHNSSRGQSFEATPNNLNDKIVHGDPKLSERRNFSPLLPNRNFPSSLNLDFSDPHYNAKSRGIPKNLEAMKLNCDQRANNGFTRGSSDEIEEIAQLMAKNQYERGLPQAERNFTQPRRDDNRTNPNVTAFPKANEKGAMTWIQREFPARKIPSSSTAMTNTRNIDSSSVPPTKRNVPEFSDSLKKFFNNGQMENQSSSIFDRYSQSQPKAPSGSGFSELGTLRNRNWQSNEQNDMFIAKMSSPTPTNMQYTDSINGSYNGMPNGEAGRGWSPYISNHMPFRDSSSGMYAPSMGRDKGKRIANLDLNVADLNAATVEEQNKSLPTESLKGAASEFQFFAKNTGTEKGRGNIDSSYSNEAIPALQLLSLMDGGLQKSNKSLADDGNRFFDKPLTAFNNHPNKPGLVEKDFFPKCGLQIGTGESSSNLNSTHGKNFPVKPCEYSSVNPPTNPYSSMFRNAETLSRAQAAKGQLFGRALPQEKSAFPFGGRMEKSSISPLDDCNKKKGAFGGVDSLVFPFQRQKLTEPMRSSNLGPRFLVGTAVSMLEEPNTDVCTLNRNPADFTYPDASNGHMINGEDLKIGNRFLFRGISVLENEHAKKKQKVVNKTTPANEWAQHRQT